jgi:AcrR family transcriptional regulator
VSTVKTRQQIAAAETQRVIVEAAARLFLERGYTATSIPRIAEEAGVAIQTIYNSIGSKSEVLSRVLDYAAAGERAPVPVPQFMREQAERASDAREIVAQLVEFLHEALPRTAPVFRVIREAAAVDSDAAELERSRAAQRLGNYGIAARLIAERDALRPRLTIDQAAATIFATAHPDTYRTLVLDGPWTHQQWSNWLRTTLQAALLRT